MKWILELPANVKRLIFALIVLCTLILKFSFFDFQYADYVAHLSVWIAHIQEGGGLSGLNGDFYNYTPLYMYVLVAIAKMEQVFDINTLYAIKVFSILFEYILAYFVGKIALLYKKDTIYFWLSLLIVPLIPAVVLDSSMMSQCDAVYSTFTVASIYFLLTKRQLTSILLLGIALSIKLQTAFVLPFFFVYMLRGYIKWYCFLLLPVVYFISIIPVWMVGRPLADLLTIYVNQSTYYDVLVSNFPNIYMWIGKFIPSVKVIYMAIYAGFVLLAGFELSRRKYTFTLSSWFKLMLVSVLFSTYFLPGILDRYLYLADILVFLYVFGNWKKLPIALCVWLVSFSARTKSIFELTAPANRSYMLELTPYIPFKGCGILLVLVIICVTYDFVKEIKKNKELGIAEEFEL